MGSKWPIKIKESAEITKCRNIIRMIENGAYDAVSAESKAEYVKINLFPGDWGSVGSTPEWLDEIVKRIFAKEYKEHICALRRKGLSESAICHAVTFIRKCDAMGVSPAGIEKPTEAELKSYSESNQQMAVRQGGDKRKK